MKNKSSPVKIYIAITALIVFVVVSLGFVAPYLISSKSDELPTIGIIYLIALPIIIFLSIKKIVKLFKN